MDVPNWGHYNLSMARVDLAVHIPGAMGEIDIATGDEVKQKVQEALGNRWEDTGHPVGKRSTFSGTVNAQQGTNQIAYFGFDIHPQQGRLWSVRKLVIMGPSGNARPFSTTALANVTAAVYASAQPVQATPVPDIDAAVTGLTIPTTQFFGPHQLTIRGQLWLSIGIQGTGVTQNLQVMGHMDGIEIDDDPRFLLDL